MFKMKKMLYGFLLTASVGLAASCCSSSSSSSSSSCSSSSDCSNDCSDPISKNLWQPHAFSGYSSTNLIQMKDAYDKEMEQGDEDPVFYLSTAGQYMQSFSGGCKGLGAMPFWSGTNKMTLGNNDGLSDVDLYQFGMGQVATTVVDGVTVAEQGFIALNPKVQHAGVDFMFNYMQHKVGRGVVAKIDLPLGAMRITPTLCEQPATLTNEADLNWTPPYPAVANRPQTLSAAFAGGSLNGSELQSQVLHPVALYKGRIAGSCCSQTAVRLADLSFTLGYNVVNEDRGFLMIGLKTTCPTGNVPTGNYALEPIFGRAGHWGLGGELSASYKCYESECGGNMTLWAQGEVLHLFSGRKPSFRSFDLKQNGKGSKYMLLQYYAAGNPATGNPTGRVASFITQAVNVTTFPVISKFDVEGSFALMLDWDKNNWNAGIGAEVWGRSAESLSVDLCGSVAAGMVNLNDYAVLGRQISQDNANNNILLNYCEPLARINKSQDVYFSTTGAPEGIVDARDADNRIPAKITEALDVCGAAAPRAVTGKVFGEMGYTWREHCHNPNLSLFGGAEFAAHSSNMINLWSVGLKGSFVF